MKLWLLLVVVTTLASSPLLSVAQRTCYPGYACPAGQCCGQDGICGSGPRFCCPPRCKGQCLCGTGYSIPSSNQSSVRSILTPMLFDAMELNVDEACQPTATGFYTYASFVAAASSFTGFRTTGVPIIRMQEIAAFLAHAAHHTTARCFNGLQVRNLNNNYDYKAAGEALGVDLLNNPDLVATDPVISFKAAIWFWMTPQDQPLTRPSSHDVITGLWTPSTADRAANRHHPRSFGVVTNIINGEIECGNGWDARVADRIDFYLRCCEILDVSPGLNLDCYHQKPFAATSDVNIAESAAAA